MDFILQITDALIVFLQSDIECETIQADDIYVFEAEDNEIIIKLDVYKYNINDSGLGHLCE